MNSVLATAAQGLYTARSNFGRAAEDIVRVATDASNAYRQAVEGAPRPRAGAAAGGRGLAPGLADTPPLETSIVSMLEARNAYAANAKVVAAAADLTDTLLDINS